ncbi:MAG TPA: pseudaminic acid biosynthesis-associated methylase [Kofleriaceae bacterium]|nr:pseudaminic acid biosynthesis-associated methylase [Kofleriaceae bacterium]
MNAETDQLRLWRSDFGRAYTDRNDAARLERVDVWRRVLEGIPPGSALEVGCNVGWNLTYLSQLGWTDVHGVEPQAYAVSRAFRRAPELHIVQGDAFALPFADASMDLVFTSGVLIHIAPESLSGALSEIYRVSRRYIVAIEYDAPSEVALSYRGEQGALWKRDHGAVWQAAYPDLAKLRTIVLGDEYDNCTAHVLEKR